jgi:hypothetical protein
VIEVSKTKKKKKTEEQSRIRTRDLLFLPFALQEGF